MPAAELIIGNLLLASLIGVLAMIVGRGGRRAGLAHALWVMFFVKLITPPLIPLPLPIPSIAHVFPAASDDSSALVAATDQPSTDQPSTTTAIASSSHQQPADPAIGIEPIDDAATVLSSQFFPAGNAAMRLRDAGVYFLLAVWLAGFGCLVVQGLLRLIRFRRLLTECGTDDPEAAKIVSAFLQQNRSAFSSRRAPRVVRLSVRVSPMLFGFAFKPIIVCPQQLWEALSDDDRRAFLAHETAHFLRRDHWVRWLEWFVSAVYWWFPGVYVGQKQLERHEEACCDAWAVKMLATKPRRYAEALLRVVDFISDHEVGLPSLASGMQPTETLEERLRLLMQNELETSPSRLHSWGSSLACAALWMVHPEAYRMEFPTLNPPQQIASIPTSKTEMPTLALDPQDVEFAEVSLPQPPTGFWNASPESRWANFSFLVSGCKLTASAGKRMLIERPDQPAIEFDSNNLTAIAEIPSSGRVVIGDSKGNVRLWDLIDGMPVSLLGRHPAGVSSLAVGPEGSVFSADSLGRVVRWELQSGRTLASWNVADAIAGISQPNAAENAATKVTVQSIRVSNDGRWVAALCGDWRQPGAPKVVHFLDSQTLLRQASQQIDSDVAIVLQTEPYGWCCVSWNGVVDSIETRQPIGNVAKHLVSALVLSQHATIDDKPTLKPAAENLE
ncbi:M48 family metalloprotease [Stieleria sp. TO1_6]|uniref:M56 family metallopeptidase n=1 Tax=Stieleria tagensis TaxID=2956795 RepID=UPI00209B56AE|nr:M56 family metallopeptidase [Stieleria tagensis]MCO8122428.1 M48 family metalloprotease [Stieleria tagensis]